MSMSQLEPVSPGSNESFDRLKFQIQQLREMMKQAGSAEEAREIISRIAQITRAYRVKNGIGIAQTPAIQALELDPAYVTRPHIQLLSEQIAHAVRMVERGINQQLIVSMPPRSGKSTLTSLYSPLWMLRRHPEWEIMLVSYDGSLSTGWSREMRRIIEDRPDLGVALKRDGGAGGHWETFEGGGMFATGTGGNLTGRGANVLIIDDPVSDFIAAHSPRLRQNLWDWWLSVAQTRLQPPYLIMVTMCMTGDTPVLRPDGTETPLAEIRPGDYVASMDHTTGTLVSRKVLNWKNQGPDDVYSITMTSGRSVRANARHPFRVVDENGDESWVRLESLQVGMKVRSITEPTEESSARKTNAESRLNHEECACGIIVKHAGLPVLGRHQTILNRHGLSVFDSGTDSLLMSISESLKPKKVAALSVEGFLMRLPSQSTGQMSSALITITSPELCEDCSATTAISSSAESEPSQDFAQLLSTWNVGTDEIVSIEPGGREDVYDIEVEGTHNFIANREESSNTRWHEDDFVGRLMSNDYEGNPKSWTQVILPAIADRSDDPMKRALGEPLLSPIVKDENEHMAVKRWDQVKEDVGSYTFAAMYQQRPAPQKGAIFDTGWWRFWTRDPGKATDDEKIIYLDPSKLTGGTWLDSWDTAFKGAEGSTSYVVGQRWVRMHANRYLISQKRGRWNFTQTIDQMLLWAKSDNPSQSPCGHLVHRRIIEEKANGAAIMNVLHDKISGLVGTNPTSSKEARARAVTPEIESGNVYLPLPSDPGNEWVTDMLSELRNFPNDANDDQVDALTQALDNLRSPGRGGITVPGGRGNNNPTVPQNRALAAYSDATRRRY
jgi:predicted phage terminase large subunit-like protein